MRHLLGEDELRLQTALRPHLPHVREGWRDACCLVSHILFYVSAKAFYFEIYVAKTKVQSIVHRLLNSNRSSYEKLAVV